MHVVVTDGHLRVTLSIIRELQAAGHTVTVVCEQGRACPGLHCRQAAHGHIFPVGLTPLAYTEWLADVCQPLHKPVLFPVGAHTVSALARHGMRLRPYAQFLCTDADTLDKANDKAAVMRTGQSLGLSTPRDLLIAEGETLADFAARLSYPVVIKYRNGEQYGLTAARRYHIARDASDFVRRYNTMSDIDPSPLVQSYVPGGGFGVSVLMDESHQPVFLFGHERLREYPISGGPSTACRSAFYPHMNEMAVTLLRALSFTGWAMVEFKGTPEAPHLLEINPRIWGSYPCATQAEAHPAQAYVKAVTEGLSVLDPLPGTPAYPVGRVTQFLINDMAAAWQHVRRGHWRQVGRFVRDALSPKVKGGVFSGKDLRGSWYYLTHLR